MSPADPGEKKDRAADESKEEIKPAKAPTLDADVLADKKSTADVPGIGKTGSDVDKMMLDTARKTEAAIKLETPLSAVQLDLKDVNPRQQSKRSDSSSAGDRTSAAVTEENSKSLFNAKSTFFSREADKTMRLTAVRDAYEKLALSLPPELNEQVKKGGRELLSLNAGMEISQAIKHLLTDNRTANGLARKGQDKADRGEEPDQTISRALKELQRLAKASPPSETAVMLINRLGGQDATTKMVNLLATDSENAKNRAFNQLIEATKDGQQGSAQNIFDSRIESARNQQLQRELAKLEAPNQHEEFARKLMREQSGANDVSAAGQLQLANMDLFNQTAASLRQDTPELETIIAQAQAGNPHSRAQLAIMSLGEPSFADNAKKASQLIEAHAKEWGHSLPQLSQKQWDSLTKEQKDAVKNLSQDFLVHSSEKSWPSSKAECLALGTHIERALGQGKEKEATVFAQALKANASAVPFELPVIAASPATKFDGKTNALDAAAQINSGEKSAALLAEINEIKPVREGDKIKEQVRRISNSEDGDYALQILKANGEVSEYHFKQKEAGKDSADDTLVGVKEGGKLLSNGSGMLEFDTHLKKPGKADSKANDKNDAWMVVEAPGKKTGDIIQQKRTFDRATNSETIIDSVTNEKIVKNANGSQEISRPGEETFSRLRLESGVTIENKKGSNEPTAMVLRDGTRIENLFNGQFRELKPNEKTGKLEETSTFNGRFQLLAPAGRIQIVANKEDGTQVYRQDGAVLKFSKNSEEFTINSSGKEIKIGAIGKDGQPTKIYSDKGDGSYSSTENGLLWKSYDKDGKLVVGSEKGEKIVLDLTRGSLTHFSADQSSITEKSFDGSTRKFEVIASGGKPQNTLEIKADGTTIAHEYKDGKQSTTKESRPDGSTRTWQYLAHPEAVAAGAEGYPVLTQRRTSKENGSKEMTFTYGIEPKPGSMPYVKSYSDSDGNWSLKANAKADSGIYINESSGEARVEQLSVAPDGRIRRASQVTADVIGLNNEAQNMREEIGMDGITLAYPQSGGALVRGQDGVPVRAISETGATKDYSYNAAGLLSKVVETQGTAVNTIEASIMHMTASWRHSDGKVDNGDWRISKTTGQEFFVFDSGRSYSRDARADKYTMVNSGEEARAKSADLMKAYEDWYYTTGGRFDALKSRLDQMTPDQIMMFRRDFAAKHANDYASFGHYIGERFGQSARAETLTEIINPRARTISQADAERTAVRLRAAMHEMKEDSWFKRSNPVLEKEMRETMANLKQSQLNTFNREYEKRHHKTALADVKALPGYAESSKVNQRATEIYHSKGSDRRTTADNKELMQLSLTGGKQFQALDGLDAEARDSARRHNRQVSLQNLEMFKEFAGRANKEAREEFRKEDGDKLLEQALVPKEQREEKREGQSNYVFNNSIFASSGDAGRVMTIGRDYARDGQTSALTKLEEENWGSGPGRERLESIFQNMSSEDRARFRRGFELSFDLASDDKNKREKADELIKSNTAAGEQANEDVKYYRDFAIKAHDLHWFSKDIKEAKYLQAAYGERLGMELDNHAGFWDHATAQNFMRSIENIDSASLNNLLDSAHLKTLLKKQIDDRFQGDERATKAWDLLEKKLQYAEAEKKKDSNLTSEQIFERTRDNVRREIVDVIADNKGSGAAKLTAIMDGITSMMPSERARYASSPEFRQQVKESISEGLKYSPLGKDALNSLLWQIEQDPSKKPEKDAITKLFEQAALSGPSITEGIKILNQTLSTEAGAKLREQLDENHPRYNAELRQSFDLAMKEVFKVKVGHDGEHSQSHWEEFKDLNSRIIEPTLAKGIVPSSEMNQYLPAKEIVASLLTIGGAQSLEQKEKDSILESLNKSLSPSQQEIAKAIIEQGQAKPEDRLRAFTLGIGKEEEALRTVDQMFEMKTSQRAPIVNAYAAKYHGDLTSDLKAQLSGKDAGRIEAAMHTDEWTSHRSYEHASQQANSVDNYGASWTWDSSRLSLEESSINYASELRKAATDHRELKDEEIRKLQANVFARIDDHVKSQGERADVIADSCIMAAAAAATVCTAGAASPLLLASFTAGAATFKLGANAYMTGENFDSRSSNVLAKLSSGAVNGFTGIFGPAEMTMLLGMGTKAATKVSGQVLSHSAFDTLSAAAKKEVQETITTSVANSLRQQVASGVYKADQQLAESVIGQLTQRGALNAEQAMVATKLLSEALPTAIKTEGTALIKNQLTTLALNQTSGASGSILSSYVEAKARGANFGFDELRDATIRGSFGALGGHYAGRLSNSLVHAGPKLESLNGAQELLRFATKGSSDFSMAVAGMSTSNFAAENLIATIRGEGYSGEGLSQQTMNASIAPFFQQMRGAYQTHNRASTTAAGDSHTNKIAHTETGDARSGNVNNSHVDGASEAKLSTGHQVRQSNEIDVANKKLAAMEVTLAKERVNMSAEQIAHQEQQIKAVKESLQNSLLKDAGELISTSLGIDKSSAEKLARDIGVNLVPAQDNLDAQGMFSSAKGQVDLYVGQGSTDSSRPSQTNIHEFAHFIDAARYQALAEANPKLFIETLASDALTGSFSKGTARIEKSVFGEDTFERQPISGNKGFSEADAKFAREQVKAYLTENFKDGKLPGVPDDRTLYRFLGTRGAEFPGADFSRNQALLHEMRREISNIRVTYSNVALSDQAIAKPAVRALVDAARQSLGTNPTKEQYLNALAGVSDATIGLTRGATDYYDFGSRYENRANRFQYSKALEQSLADTHKLVKLLSADSNLAKPDSQASQFIKQLSDATSNDSKSATLIEMLKSPQGRAALHELTTNTELAPALRETAKALVSNLETVSESTKALKFITALDMVARDAAKIKLLDQEANQGNGADRITRAQLEASKNQWLDSAFANVPEGEASRLASYMMKRGYIDQSESQALIKQSRTIDGQEENLSALQIKRSAKTETDSHYSQRTEQEKLEHAASVVSKSQLDKQSQEILLDRVKDGSVDLATAIKLAENVQPSEFIAIFEQLLKNTAAKDKMAIKELTDLSPKALKQLGELPQKSLTTVVEILNSGFRTGKELDGLLQTQKQTCEYWLDLASEQLKERPGQYSKEQLQKIISLPNQLRRLFEPEGLFSKALKDKVISHGNLNDIFTVTEDNPHALSAYAKLDAKTTETLIYEVKSENARKAMESLLRHPDADQSLVKILLDNYGGMEITAAQIEMFNSALQKGIVSTNQIKTIETLAAAEKAVFIELIQRQTNDLSAPTGGEKAVPVVNVQNIALLLPMRDKLDLLKQISAALEESKSHGHQTNITADRLTSILQKPADFRTAVLEVSKNSRVDDKTFNALLHMDLDASELRNIHAAIDKDLITPVQIQKIASLDTSSQNLWNHKIIAEAIENPSKFNKRTIDKLFEQTGELSSTFKISRLVKPEQFDQMLFGPPETLALARQLISLDERGHHGTNELLRRLANEESTISQDQLRHSIAVANEMHASSLDFKTLERKADFLQYSNKNQDDGNKLPIIEAFELSLYLDQNPLTNNPIAQAKRLRDEVLEVRAALDDQTVSIAKAYDIRKTKDSYELPNFASANNLIKEAAHIEAFIKDFQSDNLIHFDSLDLAMKARELAANGRPIDLISWDRNDNDAKNKLTNSELREWNETEFDKLEVGLDRMSAIKSSAPELSFRERNAVRELSARISEQDLTELALRFATESDESGSNRADIIKQLLMSKPGNERPASLAEQELNGLTSYLFGKMLTADHYNEATRTLLRNPHAAVADPEVLGAMMNSLQKLKGDNPDLLEESVKPLHKMAIELTDAEGPISRMDTHERTKFAEQWLAMVEFAKSKTGAQENAEPIRDLRFEIARSLDNKQIAGLSETSIAALVDAITDSRLKYIPKNEKQLLLTNIFPGIEENKFVDHRKQREHLAHLLSLSEFSPFLLDRHNQAGADKIYQTARREIEVRERKLGIRKGTIENMETFAKNLLPDALNVEVAEKILTPFDGDDRTKAVEYLKSRGKYTSTAALSQHFQDVAHELLKEGLVKSSSYSYSSRIRQIEVLALTTEGAALAYEFRKMTGIAVKVYGPNDKLPVDQKLVAFDPPEKLAPGKKLSPAGLDILIENNFVIDLPSITDFGRGVNLYDLAAAKADKPLAAQTKITRAIEFEQVPADKPSITDPVKQIESLVNYLNETVAVERSKATDRALLELVKRTTEESILDSEICANNSLLVSNERMIQQATLIHERIVEKIKLAGKEHLPDDFVFVSLDRDATKSDGTSSDSSMKALHIYRIANNLTDSMYDKHFLNLAEYRERAKLAALNGETLKVFAPNDLASTGDEAVKVHNLLHKIAVSSRAKEVEITLAPFIAYQSGIDKIITTIKNEGLSTEVINGESALSNMLSKLVARRLSATRDEFTLSESSKQKLQKQYSTSAFGQEATAVVSEISYPNTLSHRLASLIRTMGISAASEVRIGTERDSRGFDTIYSDKVSDGIFRGGRLTTNEQVEKMANAGVTKVIDLILDGTSANNSKKQAEGTWCRDCGIDYEAISLSTKSVTANELNAIASKIKEEKAKGKSVFIRCQSDPDRTRLIAAALRHQEGASYEEALSEMQKHNFTTRTSAGKRTLVLLREMYGLPPE
ncbi:MAG: hypothetical protein C0473_00655 [Cyanobacteria bacterium DS3.002]|nr:hypothetical protein [Cyanobacteria bacterium DS3.002]MBA4049612.1 hypothetical protein [Cyanobacteria bacterium DS2.008]